MIRRPVKRRCHPVTAELYQYTDDEAELLRAVARWRQNHHGRVPDYRETLAIVKNLGYRRVL